MNRKLILTVATAVLLAGCGSADPTVGTTTPVDANAAATTTTDLATTSPPTTSVATTAAPSPRAQLPEPVASPYEVTTHKLDLGTSPIDSGDQLTIAAVAPHLPFYASSYLPSNASFAGFRSRVGAGNEKGLVVSEILAAGLSHDGSAEELLEAITSEISSTQEASGEWQPYRGFDTDITFGRQLSPPPLTAEIEVPDGAIGVALAGPDDGESDTFTLYVLVIERHSDELLDELTRPPYVASIEGALTTEWAIEAAWSVKDWEYSIMPNAETGEIGQGLIFDVWFEAPASQLYESLLATGSWFEHEDFPPESSGFFLYSATAWLQASSAEELTTAIVTANP